MRQRTTTRPTAPSIRGAERRTAPTPAPADDLAGRLDVRIDPDAPAGNVLGPLARLLLTIAERERGVRGEP
jgi:hypothetical protein